MRMFLILAIALGTYCASASNVKKESEGYADENGVFHFSGETAQDANHSALISNLVSSVGEWGLVPLGEPGNIDTNGSFRVKPDWKGFPEFDSGLRFYDSDVKGRIVAIAGNDCTNSIKLAEELAWHLGKMCGSVLEVTQTLSSDPAAVEIVVADIAAAKAAGLNVGEHENGMSVIRRFGNKLYVGGSGSGVSFAVTYLLEALGCRYLWPGRTGKIIPSRSAIVLPNIDLIYGPKLKSRRMRTFRPGITKTIPALKKWWLIDPDEFMNVLAERRCDRKGNRDFWAWHGINDEPDVDGYWSGGHGFKNYWEKYGKKHPDWFALQPNGSRDQNLGTRTNRPTLCLSNTGLVAQVARDTIAGLRKYPDRKTFSICLPDGGPTTQCLCRNCRLMDPVNAPVISLFISYPWRKYVPYVSLSDRVMAFNNAVAEKVVKVIPDARLKVYVYSMYHTPTVKVKPHPALVLANVAGSYETAERKDEARVELAYWTRYKDNLHIWRPNACVAHKVTAPQNYARTAFEDLEIFKRNGVVATDYDCVNEQFSTKGLIWYMVAKAHRNPDSIGYEALFDDYCKAGFGAAAKEIRGYFEELECMTDKAVKLGKGVPSFLESFNPDVLERYLVAAEVAAAAQPDVLERIAYLRKGLSAGRMEKKLGAAWESKSKQDIRNAQHELRIFVRDTAMNFDPYALCPLGNCRAYHSPSMKNPDIVLGR